MRSAMVLLVILLCSAALMSQSTEANLQSELEGLHAKWVHLDEDESEEQ